MKPTVLHVEDDRLLAKLVRTAFHSFGFEGTIINADTMASALATIAAIKRRGAPPLDLIITDMKLPDASGLELVRRVKANPSWAITPIIVLSSEVDPETITEAYALGANCFVSKYQDDKDIFDTIKALHDCWLSGARLPESPAPDRVREQLAGAAALASRRSACYTRIAADLARSSVERTLWLNLALSGANLANLCAFLRSQLSEADLPGDLVDRFEWLHSQVEARVSVLEKGLATTPPISAPECYRWVVEFLADSDIAPFVDTLALFFPRAPVATRALRDTAAGVLGLVIGGAPLYAQAPQIDGKLETLRARLRLIKAQTP